MNKIVFASLTASIVCLACGGDGPNGTSGSLNLNGKSVSVLGVWISENDSSEFTIFEKNGIGFDVIKSGLGNDICIGFHYTLKDDEIVMVYKASENPAYPNNMNVSATVVSLDEFEMSLSIESDDGGTYESTYLIQKDYDVKAGANCPKL